MESPPPSPAPTPTKAERRYAAFAILSFWLCSLVGQIGALIWARRNNSVFVRRYAWLSLSFEAVMYTGGIALIPVVIATDGTGPSIVMFFFLYALQLAFVIFTIPLAVRAWRGHDAAGRWIPESLGRRLPKYPGPLAPSGIPSAGSEPPA